MPNRTACATIPSGLRSRPRFALLASILLLAATWAASPAPCSEPIRAVDLRCEHRTSPTGIDEVPPHLSWKLASDERGQRQTAYQVLVASSPEILAGDRGDLWDSGKVVSARTIDVPYEGRPLESSRRVHWKVRVWDSRDRPSAWSEPAAWTLGILRPEDWRARWIEARPDGAITLEGARWIWYPEGQPEKAAPPGTRYFRREVVLPPAARIRRAVALASADNQWVLHLNGVRIGEGEGWSAARDHDVTAACRPGANALAVTATNGAEAPNPAGLLAKLIIQLEDGSVVETATDGSWKCSREAPAGWLDAGFDDSTWSASRVLGEPGMEPWGAVGTGSLEALPMFRRGFEVSGPVRRAVLHACGLGFHELRLNGEKVGEDELDPGWTNYRKSCLYVSHDVTAMMRPGANAIGVLLGHGMFDVRGGRYVKFTGSFGRPCLILQLHLELEDGTTRTIATDGSWKTAASPIVFSCIYGGEDHDARRELPGWDRPGFDDASWAPAREVEGPGGRLVAQSAPPIRLLRRYPTVRVTEPRPGVLVHDLGQNFSGWPRIRVQGPAGSTVKLIPGEVLETDGLVSQRSSGGPVSFSYTLRGEGVEVWRPRFTYYGFRYVQVEGAARPDATAAGSGRPVLLDLEGHFVSSSAPVVGGFSCSSELINRIHDLIDRAVESNLQSVLTDCPHREKLGWLEVSHLLGQAILFNYDARELYRKICDDMGESQLPDGLVPDIAPEYTVFSGGFRDSPEWGSACVINPWLLWQHYGDLRAARDHYAVMRRYVDYLGGRAEGHIVSHGLGDWYDVGPGGPGESQLTSRGVTATAVYYQDIRVLERFASLLGKEEDATRYSSQASAVRAAFNARFFRRDPVGYDRDSQTALAMPLVLGLVDEAHRRAVLDKLVANVRANGNRVTAGDVGFVYLVRALHEGGRADVLHDMVTQATGPGYADQLRKGATSLTEAWDANPGSSQNHCMLGHAEEWFYRGLAGINPDPLHPGFERFVIRPEVVGDITWVKAHHDSIRGRIVSEWAREGDRLRLKVSVPPGSTAAIHVPARSADSVTESGVPAAKAPGLSLLGSQDGRVVLEAVSGTYEIESRP